jgi:hypothetical protein
MILLTSSISIQNNCKAISTDIELVTEQAISTDIKLVTERIRGNEFGTSKAFSLRNNESVIFFSDRDTRQWKARNCSDKNLHCRVKKLGSKTWQSIQIILPHYIISLGLPCKKTILVQFSHHPFPYGQLCPLPRFAIIAEEEYQVCPHLFLRKTPHGQELSNNLNRTIRPLSLLDQVLPFRKYFLFFLLMYLLADITIEPVPVVPRALPCS